MGNKNNINQVGMGQWLTSRDVFSTFNEVLTKPNESSLIYKKYADQQKLRLSEFE